MKLSFNSNESSEVRKIEYIPDEPLLLFDEFDRFLSFLYVFLLSTLKLEPAADDVSEPDELDFDISDFVDDAA